MYVLGQFLGSFMAAVTIYGLFYSECCLLGSLPRLSLLWYMGSWCSGSVNVWEKKLWK